MKILFFLLLVALNTVGAPSFVVSNLTVQGKLTIPNSAAPATGSFGVLAGDNNVWAASRGAAQFFDGTANTFLLGVLASDAPANGQVPKWNTGGTITWEDDGGSGSQTPWASDINGAGFSLTNVAILQAATLNVSTQNVGVLNLTNALGLSVGGSGSSLADPNADRILFWDDSAGSNTWLRANTGLGISGTDLNLADTAVTPGAYTSADITIDQQGRITSAANGSGSGGLPAGGMRRGVLSIHPFSLSAFWARTIINDGFEQGSSLYGGNTSYSGGGGTAASFIIIPNERVGRNGFARLAAFATNGIGGTHYSGIRHQAGGAQTLIILWSNIVYDATVSFEVGASNHLAQVGLFNAGTTSNQTAGVYWQGNIAIEINWVARCVGSSSISWTSSIPCNVMSNWTRLGFAGTTNSMVFYTNGVAAWTNASSDSLPSAPLFPMVNLMNSATNASGVGSETRMFIDDVLLYEH